MTKSKNLFKNISLFLCLVPMLLLSLFCLVPKKQYLNVAAADEVITNFNFVGSNIINVITMQNMNSGNFDRQSFVNMSLSFGVEDGVYRAAVNGYVNNPANATIQKISGVLNGVPNAEKIVSQSIFLKVYVTDDPAYGYNIIVSHSGQLSSDIIKVSYSHYQNLNPNVIKPANYYNTVTYYDSNGEYIEFCFPLFTNGQTLASNMLFENRTYYFTSSFDDNKYYNQGFEDGVEEGFNRGEDVGFENGYKSGEIVGYGNGYNAGLEYSGNYSFNSLIGAVIDAPVSAFTSLLNFELLGVNILGLITGLLSLAVIVLIIKLCMGGR